MKNRKLLLFGIILPFLIIGLSFSAFAGTKRSGAGNRGVGTRLTQAQGKSTFSRSELTVLCGRYFDECSRSYNAKKRKFKDPKCQDLMPQCFKALGPNSTQCQDKVYSCLDKICQPRSQCENEQRVKEIAVSCLEQSGKYYPYSCSPRLFQSVVSQILTEATGISAPAPQAPQTIIQNQVSPQMQAQLDAQAQQLAQQEAMLAQQQQALAQAEAEKNAQPAEPEVKELDTWDELTECENLLKTAETKMEDATYYAKCSPDIGDVEEEDESIGGFDSLDWGDVGGGNHFNGGGMMTIHEKDRNKAGNIIYYNKDNTQPETTDTTEARLQCCVPDKKTTKQCKDSHDGVGWDDAAVPDNTCKKDQVWRYKALWVENHIDSCSEKPPRLKSLRYKGNVALKELKNVRSCANKLYKKARKDQKDGDYLLMLQKKLGSINNGISKVGSAVSRLDINNFMDFTAPKTYNFKNTDTNLDDIKNTVYSSMKNLKILHEMNRIVLDDISNLYSGIELKRTDNGENACQGFTAGALDTCVSNKAQEYLNKIRDKTDVSSYVKKVEDLYFNSSYPVEAYCETSKDLSKKTDMNGCLRELKRQANKYIRDSNNR
ncbi:MAG: hypothetical protein ACTSXL_04800 [Alphaproteobacteria bacterium]|nr:MAG: hypothetical protein B6I23_00385 [Rickettsiaceae bacterium 4572_127]